MSGNDRKGLWIALGIMGSAVLVCVVVVIIVKSRDTPEEKAAKLTEEREKARTEVGFIMAQLRDDWKSVPPSPLLVMERSRKTRQHIARIKELLPKTGENDPAFEASLDKILDNCDQSDRAAEKWMRSQ